MESGGEGNKHVKSYREKEARCDPVTWAFAFLSISLSISGGKPSNCHGGIAVTGLTVCALTLGGLSTYYDQLIVVLGLTANQSLLLGTAAG
jgi:hypothetical protein